jgi:hypothetical protein
LAGAEVDTTKLLDSCRLATKPYAELGGPAQAIDATWCLGYLTGIANVLEALKRACPPDGVGGGQLALVVVKYLDDHPERRHLTPLEHVVPALTDAFPCPDKP